MLVLGFGCKYGISTSNHVVIDLQDLLHLGVIEVGNPSKINYSSIVVHLNGACIHLRIFSSVGVLGHGFVGATLDVEALCRGF